MTSMPIAVLHLHVAPQKPPLEKPQVVTILQVQSRAKENKEKQTAPGKAAQASAHIDHFSGATTTGLSRCHTKTGIYNVQKWIPV